MAKWLKLYVIYPFATSPHSCNCTTLLNTKVLNFTVSKKKLKNYVRTLSYFHQFNNFWQIHDKIAETLCLVIKACPDPRTQALIRRRHWTMTASTIDWTKCPRSLIRRISSSLTLAIVDRQTFSCSTLQMLWSIGFRFGEFGGHSVGEMKSGTFRSRKATGSCARCASSL